MNEINEAMEKLVNHYRHDFLNVLQVIGGLAQLQKTDRLLTYIRKASEEVQQFGKFIACGDPRFALNLYDRLLQDLKGSYVLHVEGTLPLLETDVLASLNPTMTAIKACLQHTAEYTLSIHVKGGQSPALIFSLLGEKNANIWHHAETAACANGLSTSIHEENCKFSLLLDKRVSSGEK